MPTRIQVFRKRPGDTRVAEFDLREWVAAREDEGVETASITFSLRVDLGITTSLNSPEAGLLLVTLEGGRAGRVYDFGVMGVSPNGESIVDMRKLRVVDPSIFALLPGDTEVPVGGDRMVDPDGDFLVDPEGNYLAAP